MYTNLDNSLKQKGISLYAAASAIDMPEATFRTKLQSRSFSVDEAFMVKRHLFPEMDIFYLFKKDDVNVSA